MVLQWVYNAGSAWVPLDSYTQDAVEVLWSRNASSWIRNSPSFAGQPIFIDTSQMTLQYNGHCYTIARRYI